MAFILNIETSTTNCSVSVSNKDEVVSLMELNEKGYSHAEKLHVFIREAVAGAGITLNDLAAIAVSKGPGSYTGLRIGVSAAKGLCFSLDKPLISIPTLTALANQLKIKKGLMVPMLDARRMEVYSAVFDAKYQQVRDTQAQIIDQDSFSDYLSRGEVHFLGNGAKKCQEVIIHENAIFHIDMEVPSAKEMVPLAHHKYLANDFEDVAYFEPYYLKDFIGVKLKK